MSHPEPVRVCRIVLVVLGLLFFALAFSKLNVRQADGTGLCGSIVQGSAHDDGGSRTPDCNRLRHHDGVTAVEFAIIGIAALGIVVGHSFYTRNQ